MYARILRYAISSALTLGIAFVAVPLSVMGAILLGNGLSDSDFREDALHGLQLLGIASLFWGALLGWFVLCGLLPIRWQFRLRTMMVLMTLVAMILGLISYATS